MKLINLLGLILVIVVAFAQARPNHHRRLKHHHRDMQDPSVEHINPDSLPLEGVEDFGFLDDSTDYPRRAKRRAYGYWPLRG